MASFNGGYVMVDFVVENMPSWRAFLFAGPPAFAWALLCLSLSAYLKWVHDLKTGYTRKVFHFLIFVSVSVTHWLWGTPAVCLFGSMASWVVFYAVLLGDGHPLYEALAREKDAPHRTLFILVPYFATLLGGLASNVLFGPVAIVGYLVTGLGDAVGEPVGTRWGRHTYRVPSLHGIACTRSIEGSIAVFAASVVAVALSVAISHDLLFTVRSALWVPPIAVACALVEAVSPHGWDNATMQIAPTWLAWMLLGGL